MADAQATRSRVATGVLDGREPSTLRNLLRRYLSTSDPAVILMNWHPLGFIDIPLGDGALSTQRRTHQPTIHVWHHEFSQPQRPSQTCHSHGWDLRSSVLVGELENVEFQMVPDANGDHRMYSIAYRESYSVSQQQPGAYTVREADRVRYRTGTTYEIASDTCHWTVPTDSLIVTAMARTATQNGMAHTFRRIPCDSEYRYSRSACPPDVRVAVVGDILDALPHSQL